MADEIPDRAPPAAAILPGISAGHPLDMVAEAAGQDMWEVVQQWRGRHPQLTRVQYLWIFNRVMAEELRAMGRQEMTDYNQRTGHQ